MKILRQCPISSRALLRSGVLCTLLLWRLRNCSCQLCAVPEVSEQPRRGVRQIFAMLPKIFYLKYLLKLKCHVKASRLVQLNRHFVILALRADRAEMNSGYDAANAIIFPDFSLVDVWRVVSKSNESSHLYQQCASPIHFVPWRECVWLVTFMESQPKDALLIPIAAKVSKDLHCNNGVLVKKAECINAHITNIDIASVNDLIHYLERNRIACSINKRDPLVFV